MEIGSCFFDGFRDLYRNAIRFGVLVMANPGDLPGDFGVRTAGSNDELAATDFVYELGLHEIVGVAFVQNSQLIAEVAIEGLKPFP